MNDENYTPYGDEWKKEVMKLRKGDIVDMLAKSLKAKKTALTELDTICTDNLAEHGLTPLAETIRAARSALGHNATVEAAPSHNSAMCASLGLSWMFTMKNPEQGMRGDPKEAVCFSEVSDLVSIFVIEVVGGGRLHCCVVQRKDAPEVDRSEGLALLPSAAPLAFPE